MLLKFDEDCDFINDCKLSSTSPRPQDPINKSLSEHGINYMINGRHYYGNSAVWYRLDQASI